MNKIKFIHLRYHSMVDSSVSSKGGVTIAFVHTPELNQAVYAISECNPLDNFDRRVGRVRSEGKLSSPKHRRSIDVAEGAHMKDVIEAIKEDYMQYKTQFMPNARDFIGWYGRSWA